MGLIVIFGLLDLLQSLTGSLPNTFILVLEQFREDGDGWLCFATHPFQDLRSGSTYRRIAFHEQRYEDWNHRLCIENSHCRQSGESGRSNI